MFGDGADAINRAWRTFVQGLFLDVVVAVVMVASVAVSDGVEWTSTYWLALAGLVAKTVVTSLVSYLARTLVPPKTG